MGRPLVSCLLPTTAERRWCLPLAIRQFLRQTYEGGPRELVVVFDGPGSVADLMPADSRVQLVIIDEGRSLGAKFNACAEASRGEILALWSDDDWHHIDRLHAAIKALDPQAPGPQALIAGDRGALFHELIAPGHTYQYQSPDASLVGGTCVFRRAVWEMHKFPDRPSGVDTVWLYALQKAKVATAEIHGPPYVAMVHGQTTGRKQWPPPGNVWSMWDGDLNKLMGDDLSAYRRAFTRKLQDK